MSRILNFKSVEIATIRMGCGAKSGTGFFVETESGESLLLTADHLLSESDTKDIIAEIEDKQVKCSILRRIPGNDVAIVRPNAFQSTISSLPLFSDMLPYNASWEAFGYPVQRIDSGARFNGKIARINDVTKWDIDLDCEQYKNLPEFNGLSGAPLLVDGYVTGIITYDITGGLGASSIFSIESELKDAKVKLIVSNKKSIPDSIENQLPDSTPNTDVFDKIKEIVSKRHTTHYFLLSGNPGSGKTTIAAQLDFEENNLVICDRYFVKVPEQDAVPTQIRATPDYFQRWVEEVYSRVLFNRPPDKPQADVKVHERLAQIQQGILALGNHYQNAGKVALLVIDGLDDVPPNVLDNFLSVLPLNLPLGLKVIISCTSRNILPAGLQSVISSDDEIKVTPLSIEKAEQFLKEQLESQNIPLSEISDLAAKSEGHPLYLRYLSRYVQNLKDITNLADWIASIPVINGEIETYYNRIWLQIQGADEIWLAGTLSRIRIPIQKDELYSVLPRSAQYAFPVALTKIEHLLKEDEKLSVYHTSFSDFVNRKTSAIEKDVHDNIALFCTSQPDTFFTISEKVYQLVNGNLASKKQSLEACNQTWVDSCVFFGVNPDIVLSDIRLVIATAAEIGIAYKVIELLLLSQRVNFRYNTLFDENATYLVNALLALEKYEDALRYVVRNNTLVVSDGDALYLLQRFYEYGADAQAEILLRAIKRTCSTVIEKGMDSESFTRYMHLRFSSVTLSSNVDPKEAFEEFNHIKSVAQKMLTTSGNGKEVITNFKDEKGSYNIGYYIWRYNIPSQTKESEKHMPHVFSDRSSGFTALSIYQAIHFSEISPLRTENNNFASWVEDLEYLLDKYGSHQDYHFALLFVLARFSKRADLIEKIHKEFFSAPPAPSFRKENGVDLDRRHVEKFLLYQECRRNLDPSESSPRSLAFGLTNWESAIANRLESIGFFYSQARKLEADGNEYKNLSLVVSGFLPTVIPDLRQRIHWERSYGLPEEIFPLLYDKLAELIVTFFPSCIPEFVNLLTGGEHYQLGLYTEGYIDSLLAIARRFTKSSKDESAFEIAKVLEVHVLKTVENRWERNEYLLRLTELYAEIENFDKANEIFSEMVNTSMGPSWYKEAQLGIINTAVSTIIPQNGEYTYLQKFAGHLDHASGEMTFQRYVKQQKEQFVGDLAKTGSLEKAIDYLKYQLLPDYETVIANAEEGLIDMANKGDGYVLGARAIEEQAGILDLLRAIEFDSSFTAYALTELFMLGDDRYIRGFSKIQAKILNTAEISDPWKVDLVLKRIVRFYLAELDDQFRTEYITSLTAKLSITNLAKLKDRFELAGIVEVGLNDIQSTTERPDSSDGDLIDTLPAIKDQALEKLKSGNKSGARKLVIEALEQVQKSKFGIWSSNYSNKINDLRDVLASTYNSSEEIIPELKTLLINEPYFEEWVIADKLIHLLQNTANEEEKQRILSTVEDHIHLMVRTPESIIDKYRWLVDKMESSARRDNSLINLVIWFLNHPSLSLKNRTFEVLYWLGEVESNLVVPALIEEIISGGYKLSRELSASIIHQIADKDPSAFFMEFDQTEQAKKDKLFELRHFMIQNSLFEAFEIVRIKTDYDVIPYLKALTKSLDNKSIKGGDVELDEVYLSSFEDHLYNLNSLGVLNRAFATDLFAIIESERPMSINDILKANKYINRSFNNFNDIYLVPDLDNLVRYAINYAILPALSLNDRRPVADILRFYQPTFPESRLAGVYIDNTKFETELKRLFVDGEDIDWEGLFDGNLLVNYYNSSYSQEKKYYEDIELVAYVIPTEEVSDSSFEFYSQTFSANGYPTSVEREIPAVPLVIVSHDANQVMGGDIVPSFANSAFFSKEGLTMNDFQYSYWRNGRNWEQKRQGAYQTSGYSVRMPETAIKSIEKKYNLFWDIYWGYEGITVDVSNRKIVAK